MTIIELVSHWEFLPIGLLLMAMAFRPRTTTRLAREFFLARTPPINLAVLRIVLFSEIILNSFVLGGTPTWDEAIWFCRVPTELITLPVGIRFLVKQMHIPADWLVNETWVRLCWQAFSITCFTGLVGVCSRTSAAVAAVSGFFAMGIPEFYGFVDHYHHWLWFAALLAVSPCGDALSVDAVYAKLTGGAIAVGRAACYALPLRFAWLLIGLIYFFPGFWKLWNCGYKWALSDNLKNMMYATWLGGWKPVFQLDQHPWLYQAGGVFTIVFELSFILLIFVPRLRPLALIGGLLFHFSTWISLDIFFWDLLGLYVVFIDWSELLSRLRRLWRKGQQQNSPVFSIPSEDAPRRRASTVMVAIVGAILVIANAFFGARRFEQGWPFACYPTFAAMVGPTTESLACYEMTKDKYYVRIDLVEELAAKTPAGPIRWTGLLNQVVEASDQRARDAKMQALWQVVERSELASPDVVGVRFCRELSWLDPDRRLENPIRRELIFKWRRPDSSVHGP